MAIFNDLGSKITKTGQDAVQKTKNFAGITRLNSSISEEEAKIKNCYTEMGRIYFEKYGAACTEPDFFPYIQGIAESMKKIEEYNTQIRMLKGVKLCAGCGMEVNAGALFCNNCGMRMMPEISQADQVVQASVFCAGCGAELEPGTVFCTSCGKKQEIQEDMTEWIE